MKNLILVIGSFLLLFVLIHCEKDPDTVIDDKIIFVKTESGGCNGQLFDDLKSTNEDQADTVKFSFGDDTLDIFVGLNYICCAPWETEVSISNDSIIMKLNDTWDFLLVDFEEKDYIFQIILDDPREENPIIFMEGTLAISSGS